MFVGEDDCLKIGDFGLSRTEAVIAAGVGAEDDDECPDAAAAAAATAAFEAPTTSAAEQQQRQAAVAAVARPDQAALVPRLLPPPPRVLGREDEEGHTTGVGTASYASPEQLQGRQYGVRSDLFSLGLILLELCCCFTTTHERADAFQAMRRPRGGDGGGGGGGAAPAHLAARSPAVAELAELLCRTDPELRPSASELLERLDALGGGFGCGSPDCPGIAHPGGDSRGSPGGRSLSGSGRGGGWGAVGGGGEEGSATETGDVRLREELAAKTRKVEEQVRSSVIFPLFSVFFLFRTFCLLVFFGAQQGGIYTNEICFFHFSFFVFRFSTPFPFSFSFSVRVAPKNYSSPFER